MPFKSERRCSVAPASSAQAPTAERARGRSRTCIACAKGFVAIAHSVPHDEHRCASPQVMQRKRCKKPATWTHD
eukprot:4045219-Pyramimonas_sp.AAC.1